MNVSDFLHDHHVHFDAILHSGAKDAQHLAHAVHAPGRIVAKTVLLRANHRYGYLVAVLPATRHVDLERLSKALGGCELELATEDEIAEHCPDCALGVLPPFGLQYAMQTVVDQSLAQEDEIVFAGNTHQVAIRMKFDDFKRLEQPLILPIAKE